MLRREARGIHQLPQEKTPCDLALTRKASSSELLTICGRDATELSSASWHGARAKLLKWSGNLCTGQAGRAGRETASAIVRYFR